ncbi:MAG TPA: ribosome maturation factor RimP [Firmicutes bacterium]|nr:ribosome maturation factor RimP [Bacillota bacterium]
MGGRVEDRIAALAEPIIEELKLELVDVEYRKEGSRWYLRLFIDKEGGVDVEDCREVSERVGQVLDEADPIPHSYYLEVSSPGVERPLKKKEDYLRFRGRTIKLKTYSPVAGRRNFRGLLQGIEADKVIIEVEKEQIAIPLEQVAKAHLVLEF